MNRENDKTKLSWLHKGNKLLLSGELNQNSLMPLWSLRHKVMKDVTYIDLSNIFRIDTSGIALLIHLIALGKENGKNVTILHISDEILSLTSLYNLPDDILPH